MPSKPRPCGRPILVGQGPPATIAGFEAGGGTLCGYERMKGKQQCVWHWLLKQSANVQRVNAQARYAARPSMEPRPRVSKDLWPFGERWCSGCQSFVPLFYTSGSRCKSCTSVASHERMVAKVYDLEPGEYDALFNLQRGRCYICGRKSPSRRLAVDHDHETGAVRGLLCPDPDRGCNHKVLGPLEANSVDGGLAAARRMVDYLEDPPYARLRRGATAAREPGWPSRALSQPSSGTSGDPAPF